MTLQSRSRRGQGEEGSALIIALVFLSTVAVAVTALLSFTEVGLLASKRYDFKARARSTAAAEGGITTAIERYRSAKGPCDDFTAPLIPGSPDPAPINDQGVIVRCQGPPPGGSKATQPLNTLLSLGESDADGITSSGELRLLGGGVFSHTKVSTTASLVVQGEVSALGSCTGPIQAAQVRCANSNPANPADPSRGRDPGYTPALTVVPLRQTAPAPAPACGGSWLIPIEPGYYDDAAAFNALTGAGSCNDKVVWLKPGAYYLDFGFRGGPTTTWTVDNPSVVVVGGAPKGPAGWDATPDPTAARPTLAVPGSCRSDGDPEPYAGVQLVAGGDTRLNVTSGRMELCAASSATDQQIALFGLGTPPVADLHVLESTDLTGAAFTSALDAQTVGEEPLKVATAELTPAEPDASLDLQAFRPAVPLGSVVTGASLVVRHRDDGDAGPITVTADFPDSACGPGTSPTAPQVLDPSPGSMAEDRIDLVTTCGLGGPTTSKVRRPQDLAALAVAYTATLASGGSSAESQVDGVVLEVTYTSPVTRRAAAASSPAPGFTDPAAALEIGERPDRRTADAALSSAGATSASITLAGIGDPPLPATATVQSAVLRVAHQEQASAATISFPFGPGTCTLPVPPSPVPPPPGGITEDRIDLADCGTSPITPAQLKALAPTFTAVLAAGQAAGTSRLDGLWLEVASTVSGPPAAPPSTARQAKTATSTGFLPAEQARVIDSVTASAGLTGFTNQAALTADGFNESLPLPAGSKISSARLRVRHQEDAGVDTVEVAPTFPGGTCLREVIPNAGALTSFDGADLALCGLNTPERLAGLAATYTATRRTDSSTQAPTTATEDGGFTDAQAKGLVIDGVEAAATLNGGATTASVSLSGFPPPAPEGWTLEAARLRIAHREVGDILPDGVKASLNFTGNTCTGPRALTLHNDAIGEDVIDLTACGLTDPLRLDDLRAAFSAALAPGEAKTASAFLDGVALDLTYRPPATATLDGIELDIVFQAPTLRPLCPVTRCDLIRVAPATPADEATRFASSGTIYAPTAGLDISLYGLETQVLKRGVIARSIMLGLQPKPSYKRPLASIPPEIVTFTAYPDTTLAPTTVVATGFDDPVLAGEGATTLRDGRTADATLDATSSTATAQLSGFRSDVAISGAIDGVVLRARHQDVGNTLQVTVKVGGNPCLSRELAPQPANLTPDGPEGEDQIDLAPCGIDTTDELAATSVTYTVTKDPDPAVATATARLDGITIEALSGPMVRAAVTFDRETATVASWEILR